MDNPLIIFLSVLTGLVIGVVIMVIISKAGLNKDQQKASMLLKEAETKADSMVKQAVLDGRTQAHELKIAAEKEIKERKQEVTDMENKLLRREDNLNFRDETLTSKEKQIDVKSAQLADKMAMLDKKDKELQEKIDVQVEELERVASLTTAEAREELMVITEKRMEKETMAYIKEKEEEAKSIADEKARNIVALSIQRISSDEAVDRTVSVVSLPSEEMKGRIIGREGRNIKAIEQATGVDLIIDDTPETITVSCFDPIRREVARLALEHLIKDGRIQPGRIEEVVHKIKKEMDTNIMKTGEDTVFKLGIGRIDREIIRLIGRLKYRFSYGQNALQHSMEVAHLTGMMAAELGLNQQLAKRAGLLHDIGKALDFEVEGSHIELGYKFCKKHGEREVVLNAIQSHHGEVEPQFLISNLVIAADTISAARPGARYEALQNYINRLEELEKITKSFDGVDSAYAIQAGREVRVMAVPEKMDDLGCHKLARDIKDKIEAELTYPGQIKVTVIRETRACELAK
ncbi:ribonuclease Y [[Clostridium] innocuum]|nr:ribonuclease Y [Erysipelotrichaceae bacterium]MCR0382894.1 ribonuclease Y [[Clostridium] innocuum]MCR0412833.1 ribonuclease Y [[Clostridium] innocuum]MCR0533983.1 ribonuclease Y [[Clostridium] innocuum]MCR0538453.1 ribonuclease Y [[Clostridium] innocuum]